MIFFEINKILLVIIIIMFTIQNFGSRVELRSDTFSLPTDEMRESAKYSICGDNVWDTDETTVQLEKYVAELFGKPAGLFVSSGTQGNLISLMVHAKGFSAILGNKSHINVYEQGGISTIGGIFPRIVNNLPDGSMEIKDILDQIPDSNIHYCPPKVLCLEMTHNICNGDIPSLEFVKECQRICFEKKIKLHLDGARVWNACVGLGIEPHQLAEHFDTISVCLSKGIGAPIGTVIVGDSEFIGKAKLFRKALGGGMRQTGMIAAPALIAVKNWKQTITRDHQNALHFSKSVSEFVVVQKTVSNIVKFSIPNVHAITVCQHLQKYDVWTSPVGSTDTIRAVFHASITQENLEKAIQSVRETANHFRLENTRI